MTARPAFAGGVPGGWHIVDRGAVASTMDEARSLSGEGAPGCTVVRAVEQTGGRGRLGRPWASPPGNVYATFVLRPEIPTARAAELSIVAAVAVAEAVAGFVDGVSLKWPNDVLVDGAKVAGVLLEAVAEGNRISAVLIGTGINVASRPELPDRRTARIAGSDADAVFGALLAAMDRRYRQWEREGLGGIREAWMALGPGIGSRITIYQGAERLDGRFAGLDENGALMLGLDDGSVRRIASGEVVA